MKINLGTAAWAAFRIWFLAVLFNTLLGTAYITGFFTNVQDMGLIFGFGLFLGGAASFPIFILLTVLIYYCAKKISNGHLFFTMVLVTGILSTVVVFMCMGFFDEPSLPFIGVISGAGAIATQFRTLTSFGSDEFENVFQP